MFTPRREHARFCSAACRVAWNQEHTGNPQAGASALDWSVTAMHDAVERLAGQEPPDQARGFEMISDAVWRVTLVDATLVRYHHRAYEAVMRAQDPAARQAVEGTLARLRSCVTGWVITPIPPSSSSPGTAVPAPVMAPRPGGGDPCRNQRWHRSRRAGGHGR